MRPPGIVLVAWSRFGLLAAGIADAAERLGSHLQEAGDMHHGSTEHYLGLLPEKAFVALGSILEALAVGVFLAADSHMLKYLTVEHLHFLVANHEVVKVIIGDGIEAAVLERLDDKAAGLLFEEALNAEDYATLIGEVLRHIALVLIIILANHTLVNEIHGSAHLAGRQDRFALLELHGYKNAPQSINALRSERAINTGNLSCHISTSVHCLLF